MKHIESSDSQTDGKLISRRGLIVATFLSLAAAAVTGKNIQEILSQPEQRAANKPLISDRPKAIFFIEEHPESLAIRHPSLTRPQALARILNHEACEYLEQQGWGIALATIDLDPETGNLLKKLNKTFPKMPLVMWNVFPNDELGYLPNESNIPQTKERLKQIEEFCGIYDLNIDGIGLDLEPPIQFNRELNRGPEAAARAIVERHRTLRELKEKGFHPEQEFAEIVQGLREKGFRTETYKVPRLVRTVFAAPEVSNTDQAFTMVYSTQVPLTFARMYVGDGLVPGTNPAFGVISSTSFDPGRDFGGGPSRLNKEPELTRDVAWMRQKGNREGKDYLGDFRVFAFTGLEVAQWTQKALIRANNMF